MAKQRNPRDGEGYGKDGEIRPLPAGPVPADMSEPPADDAPETPNSWWYCLDCDLPTMPGISAARHLDDLDHTVVRMR